MLNKVLGAVLGTLLVIVAVRIAVVEWFGEEEPEHEESELHEEDGVEVIVADGLGGGDAGAGQAVSFQCIGCHTFGEGEDTRVGPNLFGIVARAVGGVDGFSYSDALAAMNGDGSTWTLELLGAFLANPQQAAPGTAMGFGGIGDETDLNDLLAYLATLGGADEAAAAELPADDAPAPVDLAAPAGEPAPADDAAPVADAGGVEVAVGAADAAAGQTTSFQCIGCHTFGEGEGTRVGPNLFGIVDRAVGGVDGFSYSDALAAMNGDGSTWTLELLGAFLANPQQAAPGTSMGFGGVGSETDLNNLLAYLATLGGADEAAAAELPADDAAAPVDLAAPAGEPAPADDAGGVEVAVAAADAAAGQTTSFQCIGCHTFGEGEGTRVGPNLFGIVDRAVGGVDGFTYSDALAAMSGDGSTWTLDRLSAFLANPQAAAPGTSMGFGGVGSETDLNNLLAYLATLGGVEESAAAEPPADDAVAPVELAAPAGEPAPVDDAAPVDDGGGVEVAVAAADAAAGQTTSFQCIGCHTFGEGEDTRVGPNLFGIVDRAVGGVDGFGYSDALAAMNGDGSTWTLELLGAFLANPQQAAPGTTMGFGGVRDEAALLNLLAYLASLAGPDEAAQLEEPPPDIGAPPGDEAGPAEDVAAVEPVELAAASFNIVQVNWGEGQYDAECARCHGDRGEGGGAPALVGEVFVDVWAVRSVADLRTAMRDQPPHPGEDISDDDYAAIIAYLLSENGLEASNVVLPAAADDQAGIGNFQ